MTDSTESIDKALENLLLVAREVGPELPEDLLRRIYAAQKRHQFDRDREESRRALQLILDEFIAKGGAE